jgi:hypothetical protein
MKTTTNIINRVFALTVFAWLAVPMLTQADCTSAPSGLVGWWPGDGNADDITSGNNGTLQNCATFASGEVAQSFSLDNHTDYGFVLVGDPVPPSLQIQSEITLSAWIYVTQYPASNTLGLIVGSQYDSAIAGATIFLDGRTNPDSQAAPPGHIHFQIGDGSWHVTNVNAQVPLNQWVHIVATRRVNEDAKVYYNGLLQPSTSVPWSGSISYNGAWFAIGRQKDLGRPFTGLIDEVQIYNRALSAGEVLTLYNGGSPPSNLASWWPGDGNADDVVGGNNGTLQNGVGFNSGEVGQSFCLSGGGNRFVLVGDPVPAVLQIQNEITLSAWIYATTYPDGNLGLIVGSQFDPAAAGATIFLDGRTNPDGQPSPPGHIHFQIGGDGSFHTTNVNAQVPFNEWVHIAATRRANEDAKVYYNGVLQPSTSVPWSGAISYSGAWFAIGQQKGLSRPFDGLIDEVQVFERALSESEVQAIYNAGSAGECKPIPTPTASPTPTATATATATAAATATIPPSPTPTPTSTPTPTPTPACAAQVQPPINADGSSVFTVRRGVVPVKFSLTCNGNSTCNLPPATIAVTRTAGGVLGEVNESVYSNPADSGSNFRIDNCQYIYNLNSSALGVGTYRIDILMNSQVVGSATFQLK